MTNAPYNTRNTPSQATLPDRQVPNALLRRETVQRIFVIKLRHFGDVLLMTPLLSTLRVNYPNALIDVLVYDGTEAILAGNQDVYLAYTVDRNLKHQRLKAQYRGEQALWNSLRTGHYDLVINLSDQWRAALYCRFLKPTSAWDFGTPNATTGCGRPAIRYWLTLPTPRNTPC